MNNNKNKTAFKSLPKAGTEATHFAAAVPSWEATLLCPYSQYLWILPSTAYNPTMPWTCCNFFHIPCTSTDARVIADVVSAIMWWCKTWLLRMSNMWCVFSTRLVLLPCVDWRNSWMNVCFWCEFVECPIYQKQLWLIQHLTKTLEVPSLTFRHILLSNRMLFI